MQYKVVDFYKIVQTFLFVKSLKNIKNLLYRQISLGFRHLEYFFQ